jgi:TonB family protein
MGRLSHLTVAFAYAVGWLSFVEVSVVNSYLRNYRIASQTIASQEMPRGSFGLLPTPTSRGSSFAISAFANLSACALVLYFALNLHPFAEHKYEETILIIPTTPPPPPVNVKLPELQKITPPEPPKLEAKLDTPKILMPKPEPKPEPKPVQMDVKVDMPLIKTAKPSVVLAPQPKAALAAAMPAQDNTVKASTAQVHLGRTFGVTPNPTALKPATIAAIGNPYGGLQGPAVAPHGVVGSAGIGNGVQSGSNAWIVGRVASVGMAGAAAAAMTTTGKVGSVGIPKAVEAAPVQQVAAVPRSTSIEVLSKPAVQYTAEARQLKIQGDVVLRVTFTAEGQVVVQGVTRRLGHGLDEEARRVAQRIRFRPATKNGQPVDSTTYITINFQLADGQ